MIRVFGEFLLDSGVDRESFLVHSLEVSSSDHRLTRTLLAEALHLDFEGSPPRSSHLSRHRNRASTTRCTANSEIDEARISNEVVLDVRGVRWLRDRRIVLIERVCVRDDQLLAS